MRPAIPHVAALAVVAACAWLAQWQVERAGEKREILARWNRPVPADLDALEPPYELPRPVAGVGLWDADRQLLIDNRVRSGRTGVDVLTPFRLPDGRVFLVNRGWAPWPSRSAPLPDPPIEDAGAGIRGVLDTPPGTGVRLGRPETPGAGDWPVLMTYFDQDVLRRLYRGELQPAVIRLDPEHPAHLTGDAWQVVTFGPARHIGYAWTWGTISLVVTAIWLVLTVRQIRARGDGR